MDGDQPASLVYRRARFVTALPVDFLYTPSHAWLARAEDHRWRVGLTKFATRMLGEMVDHGFQVEAGAAVQAGQILGWVEGFKAITDLYCVVDGVFLGTNLALQEDVGLITRDPYGAGWLYEARGQPDTRSLDVRAYRDLLDKTIDRLRQKQEEREKSE
jgi:glycine cleavage system H protein